MFDKLLDILSLYRKDRITNKLIEAYKNSDKQEFVKQLKHARLYNCTRTCTLIKTIVVPADNYEFAELLIGQKHYGCKRMYETIMNDIFYHTPNIYRSKYFPATFRFYRRFIEQFVPLHLKNCYNYMDDITYRLSNIRRFSVDAANFDSMTEYMTEYMIEYMNYIKWTIYTVFSGSPQPDTPPPTQTGTSLCILAASLSRWKIYRELYDYYTLENRYKVDRVFMQSAERIQTAWLAYRERKLKRHIALICHHKKLSPEIAQVIYAHMKE